MTSKSGSGKKSGSTRSGDAGEKDRLIAELKDRVAVLENEFRLKQSDVTSREVIDRMLMGEYLVLFQRMVDKAADMVFLLGPMGRIQYVNEAACKALGYTREELQSMTVFDINQKHHVDNWWEHEEELKKQGSMTFENVFKTKDNRLIPVEISANYARLGDTEYNYSFIRDITERKRAEEALRESEAHRKVAEAVEVERKRLFAVLETLPMMICLLTPDYHVPFANRSYRERFGESHGRHCYEYCFGNTEPCDFCEAYNVLKTGQPHYWEVKGPDDSLIEVYNSPFIDVDGSPMILKMSVNITERKLAEVALRESEEKFRLLAETSPAAIFIYQDNKYVYVNPATESISGYSRDELMKMSPLAVVHPAYREKVENIASQCKQGIKFPSRYEMKILTKDGRERWMDSSSAMTMYKNRPAGLAVAFDITERKRAENALLESEEKFRVLAETSPAAIFLYQGEKYVYVNPMAETLTGYSMGELLAGDAWEWIHPEFQELVKGRARKRQLGEKLPNQYEVKYRARDGREGWVDFAAGLIEYGGKPAGLAMAFDVTKRKQAEEALNRDRYILAKSQETAHVGNWAWDIQTGEITGSAENYRIFGYESDEVKPTLEWVLSRVLHDDRTMLTDFMEARTRDGKRGSIDYRIVRPDGSVRYVNTIVDKAVRGISGNMKRLYGISQDVTERKQAEKELVNAKAQAELYLDLMGHDINNLHQVALGYLELARDIPAGEKQAMFLDKPVEVLQRSAILISNVRKLQKLRDGVFKTELIDLCQVLSDVCREFGAVPNKRVTLNINGYERCFVRANELLHDVFANVVNNAVKHTGDRATIVVDMDVVKDDGNRYCRVAVEDDGPGIPDEFKAKIFNRMLEGTSKSKGMGLGLYLVKSLVDSYDGRVWVEDRVPGDHTKGARFVVMLPAIEK